MPLHVLVVALGMFAEHQHVDTLSNDFIRFIAENHLCRFVERLLLGQSNSAKFQKLEAEIV